MLQFRTTTEKNEARARAEMTAQTKLSIYARAKSAAAEAAKEADHAHYLATSAATRARARRAEANVISTEEAEVIARRAHYTAVYRAEIARRADQHAADLNARAEARRADYERAATEAEAVKAAPIVPDTAPAPLTATEKAKVEKRTKAAAVKAAPAVHIPEKPITPKGQPKPKKDSRAAFPVVLENIPTAEAIENARRAAIIEAAEAVSGEAKAEAEKTRRAADELAKTAEKLTAAYFAFKEISEAFSGEDESEEAEEARDRTCAARTKAKAAREEAEEAREAAEIAEATAAATDCRRIISGREMCVTYRIYTHADINLLEAKAALKEAEENEAAADILKAKREAVKAAKAAAEAAEADAPRISFYIGYSIPNNRPSLSIAYAHTIAAAMCKKLHIVNGVKQTSALLNIFEYPELTEAAARIVAKRTAANAVIRQGTPTQWAIYFDCLAARWNSHDIADMTAEAAAALCLTLAGEAAAERERRAALTMRKTAANLRKYAAEDMRSRRRVLNAAEAVSRTYTRNGKADCRIIDDEKKLESRAAAIEYALNARALFAAGNTPAALNSAIRAAYRSVNSYLIDSRAIQNAAKNPHLSLDEIADSIEYTIDYYGESVSEYRARRAEILSEAIRELNAALTKRQLDFLRALYRCNGNTRAAARVLKVNPCTVFEYRAKISKTFASCISAAAPASIEAKAAALYAYIADIETTAAAADLTAKKSRARAEKAKAAAAADLTAAAEMNADISIIVNGVINNLPVKMQEVTILLQNGNSYREAAKTLEKGVATVREAAQKAAEKIRAALIAADLNINEETIKNASAVTLFQLTK